MLLRWLRAIKEEGSGGAVIRLWTIGLGITFPGDVGGLIRAEAASSYLKFVCAC